MQELIAPQKLREDSSKIQLFNITDKNSNAKNNYNPFLADEENLNQEESEKDFSLFA